MNAKQLIATVALFAATGAAFAQSTEYADPAAGFVSTKTRAEVRAELAQAQREGYSANIGTTYQDTAEALEETDVAIIPKEDFDELVNKNAEVTKKFIQLLAKNIFAKETQLLGLAYNSLRKKVADAILLLQKKYQDNNDENFAIDISRENLATIAGTATESLIRTLSDFRSEKLIDIHEGRINILNKKKLESLFN